MNNQPKQGALRLSVYINLPSDPTEYPVNDLNHAVQLRNSIASSHLLNDKIVSNLFVLEEFDGYEWTEKTDEDGNTFNDMY